jgi:hypothetical protein
MTRHSAELIGLLSNPVEVVEASWKNGRIVGTTGDGVDVTPAA